MFDNLREDTRKLKLIKTKSFPWYVLESLLFENGYQAVVLYRMASWFKRHKIPFFGPFLARLSLFLNGVDVSPAAQIGPGLMIVHGVGLVIGNEARIGRDAMLLHQVTIGAPAYERRGSMPKLGDNVFVAAGSRLIGDIEIGDNVFVGANSVITRDVPANSRVVSSGELKIVPRKGDTGPPMPPAVPQAAPEPDQSPDQS
jgi:serine O-acetyltransferase